YTGPFPFENLTQRIVPPSPARLAPSRLTELSSVHAGEARRVAPQLFYAPTVGRVAEARTDGADVFDAFEGRRAFRNGSGIVTHDKHVADHLGGAFVLSETCEHIGQKMMDSPCRRTLRHRLQERPTVAKLLSLPMPDPVRVHQARHRFVIRFVETPEEARDEVHGFTAPLA